MYCKRCGSTIIEHGRCPICGQAHITKSRFVAGMLQLFLGFLGVGRFYLGYKKIGLLQLITSVLTVGVVGWIWGFADGIMILNGSPVVDALGDELE